MEQTRPGLFCRFKNTFIGDKAFYSTVFALIMPIIVQNTVSNFVSLLDNVMVGRVGTLQMSGVAIANQLIFVYSLAIFGAVSGAGIYGAQFAGARDWDGLRHSFRFKLLVAVVITAVGAAVMALWDSPLISLFLTGDGDAADAAAILSYSRSYLAVMLFGLLPFSISQCYSGTLRETGETLLPMLASIAAVLVNLTFNYILIYGKCGFPELGVTGAAIATVLSRFVELGIIVVWTHTHHGKFHFMTGVYRSLKIGKALAKSIAGKSIPLLANELLWSLGITTLVQMFSTRGLTVVAALNISSTITNLFNVFFISMGTAVAVMVGQDLGADDIELAKKHVWKLIFFSVAVCVFIALVLMVAAGYIPAIYKTEADVRDLAAVFMRTSALYMAFNAVAHCCYFTLRSGGKTFVTMLFDSVYTWVVCVPYTYLLVHYTALDIGLLYPVAYLTDALKCVVGLLVVRTGYWAKNIVGKSQA